MKLRPYQRECVNRVVEEWQAGNTATLAVMPTGTGKTCAAATLLAEQLDGGRAMILAHRGELIYQAVTRLKEDVGLHCDVEMADLRADQAGMWRSPVVVSTIQSQIAGSNGYRRFMKFDPYEFTIVWVDEAHHVAAPSYRAVLDHYKQNTGLRIFGCTATPDRHDEKALGQVFESCAFNYGIVDAIKDGWLVDIHQQFVHVDGLDLSACRTTAGDLNGGDLARVLETERNLHEIATPTLEITKGRKTIVFCASVFQAERLAEILCRHQSGCAEVVTGTTANEVRADRIGRFKLGSYPFLINVGIATEGFDVPDIECVVCARPTKSRALYSQMVGRGTRPLTGVGIDDVETADERRAIIAASAKPSMLVLDFVGNAGKHKLVSAIDVLGGEYDEEVAALAERQAQQTGKPISVMDALADAQRREREMKEAAERKRREHVKAKATYKTMGIDPFNVFGIMPRREFAGGWTEHPASDAQLGLLKKFGYEPTEAITKARAGQLITEFIRRRERGLCTYKQSIWLRKFGIDPTLIKFAEATKILDGRFGKR